MLDHGHSDECGSYLVLEWIDGEFETFTSRAAESLVVFKKLLDALAYLHAQGLVHRDLKPANIRVRRATGEPVLIDFGSATGDDGRVTAAYASPEQLLGGPVTAASDVYQCGLILYELLTGHHPFLDGDPDLAHPDWVPRLLHPQLDGLLVRCLAPNPDDRFADASELGAALEGQPAQRSRRVWHIRSLVRRHGRQLIAVGLTVIVLAGLATAYRDRAERSRVAADTRLLSGLIREVYQPLADRPGNLASRAQLLRQVERLATGLHSAAYQDESVGYELAGFYHDLAGLRGEVFAEHTGEYRNSLQVQQQGLDIVKYWRGRLPDSDRWLRLECGASLEYGDLLFGARSWPQALTQYRESAQVWRRWLAMHPDDAHAQFTATVARSMEGDVLAELGHPEQSLPLQAEVLALRRRHRAAGYPWAAEAVASVLESIGDCHYRLGHWSEADRALGEALTIRQSLGTEGRFLAQLHMRVAKLKRATQAPQRAADHWRQARVVLQRVCQSEPASTFDRQLLAEVSAELDGRSGDSPKTPLRQ